jgi:hypothetical protein
MKSPLLLILLIAVSLPAATALGQQIDPALQGYWTLNKYSDVNR